jgi:hypothetical protein
MTVDCMLGIANRKIQPLVKVEKRVAIFSSSFPLIIFLHIFQTS